ncbi:MAG: exosortase family protein XrtF [Bacteroidota bacterium]|nr:exosortase family protein XrtF [Bacteroidota bacterium]
MKKNFQKYRPFIKFVLTFFGIYITFTILYNLFINSYNNQEYPLDPFTKTLSEQVEIVGKAIGQNIRTYQYIGEKYTRLAYDDNSVARIVEGCNAVNVMIYFVAFVFATGTNIRKTIIFSILGLISIHIINIFRIIVLSYLLHKFPAHTHITHGIIFPLIIYGFVFVLWVLWLVKFSGFIKNKND